MAANIKNVLEILQQKIANASTSDSTDDLIKLFKAAKKAGGSVIRSVDSDGALPDAATATDRIIFSKGAGGLRFNNNGNWDYVIGGAVYTPPATIIYEFIDTASQAFDNGEGVNTTYVRTISGASTQADTGDQYASTSNYQTVKIDADNESVVYTNIPAFSFTADDVGAGQRILWAIKFDSISGISIGSAFKDNNGKEFAFVTNTNPLIIPDNLSGAYAFDTVFEANTWYIMCPYFPAGGVERFRVKKVSAGLPYNVSRTGSSSGYAAPTVANNNSLAVFGAGTPPGVGGYTSRSTWPQQLAGIGLYDVSQSTIDEAIEDFATILFG